MQVDLADSIISSRNPLAALEKKLTTSPPPELFAHRHGGDVDPMADHQIRVDGLMERTIDGANDELRVSTPTIQASCFHHLVIDARDPISPQQFVEIIQHHVLAEQLSSVCHSSCHGDQECRMIDTRKEVVRAAFQLPPLRSKHGPIQIKRHTPQLSHEGTIQTFGITDIDVNVLLLNEILQHACSCFGLLDACLLHLNTECISRQASLERCITRDSRPTLDLKRAHGSRSMQIHGERRLKKRGG
mmetsp:Transcript_52350/g.162499  ORF Transcript_52350/g.162499 Transcript_52350/m.162499 type:complete len:245 (+) Transcript_52350:557-1291(+)